MTIRYVNGCELAVDSPHRASCLCGAIKFEVRGELGEVGHCHCSMCQKAHGAAYATYVNVNLSDLKITEGDDYLGRYESSPGIVRTFCKQCGATLQFIRDGKDNVGVAAGAFDTTMKTGVDYEIWTSSSVDWGDRTDIPLTHETQPGE